ncbi:MAG: MFS transporter [Sphingomonas sp.]
MYGLSLLDRGVLNLLVDPIRRDLGASDVQISLLQGFAFVTFYCVCGIPLGWLADRASRRRLIFLGVLTWSLATASCGLAQNYGQLLAARFMVGAGEAALLPAAYSMISDLFPRHKVTTAIGIFSLGAVAGSGLSSVIGGGIIALAIHHDFGAVVGHSHAPSWRTVFVLTGCLGFLPAFLVLSVPEPARHRFRSSRAPLAFWGFVATNKMFLATHFIGFSFISLAINAGAAWMPTYINRHFGLAMTVVGPSIGTGVALFGILGMSLGTRLVDRILAGGRADAHFRYFVFGGIMVAILGAAASIMPDAWPAILLYSATYFFTPVAVAGAALQLVAPSELRGRLSALFLIAFNLLSLGVGPLAVSVTTRYLFRDPELLGPSIGAVFAVFGLAGAAVLAAGRAPARAAMAAAHPSSPPSSPVAPVDRYATSREDVAAKPA